MIKVSFRVNILIAKYIKVLLKLQCRIKAYSLLFQNNDSSQYAYVNQSALFNQPSLCNHPALIHKLIGTSSDVCCYSFRKE